LFVQRSNKLKKSSAFFPQLQENLSSTIQYKREENNNKTNNGSKTVTTEKTVQLRYKIRNK
jgi:hypothetical protein